jgi:predicted MPP superfamily phosphohydrolase
MTPEWRWPVILALGVPAALGHVCHLVVAVNLISSTAIHERVLDRVRAILFAGFWISAAFLLWKHLGEPWWNWPWPLASYAFLCLVSGAVGWPLASLWLLLRRRPAGIAGTSRTIDLTRSSGPEALIGESRRSWMLRLPGHDSFRLCLREWDVTIPNLPAALDGLQIVQLSDFHFSPCFQRQFFEAVVGASIDWRADLILVTGDVVDHRDAVPWIEKVLGPLESRLGKFAVLGNHDQEHDTDAILHELGRAGFETLSGQWSVLEFDGTTLAIGGTSAPWGPAIDPSQVPPAGFRILLSHTPDLLYQADSWGVDLMFAGHNHGGQIRLPLVGPVFMPSRYSRRLDRGFFRSGGTLLYVSEGIAGKHPVRYGCPPEVTRFSLKSGREVSRDRAGELALPHGPVSAAPNFGTSAVAISG